MTNRRRETAGRPCTDVGSALPRVRTCAPRTFPGDRGRSAASKLRPSDARHGRSADVIRDYEISVDRVFAKRPWSRLHADCVVKRGPLPLRSPPKRELGRQERRRSDFAEGINPLGDRGLQQRVVTDDHCVLRGTEQAWFRVRLRNICGTRSKQEALPNVRSMQKTLIDQGFCEVGGDGFEPPTPAL
jgi:hypothetical protein